jgi:histidine triad (HIT) family protein
VNPEIKKQLEEQKKSCIFCRIISGEYPAKTIYEDQEVISMLDIRPAIKGHLLYLPKEHYPIMPLMPPEVFRHYFGLIPQLVSALKKALVKTGVTIFIANGGAAGQQAPHFVTHFFPREKGDGFFNFLFKTKNNPLDQEIVQILVRNLNIMMNNHFGREPAPWHQGMGEQALHLEENYHNSVLLYEDEKVACFLPEKGLVMGQIEVYSKIEDKNIENLSIADSQHFFYVASYVSTLLFEGLKMQGTNIIVKSGTSDDNSSGKLCAYILPRHEQDGFNKNFLWDSQDPKYNLDELVPKIKDKTWKIKYEEVKLVEPQTKINEIQAAIDLIKNQ